MPQSLIVWITTNCGKFFKQWEYQTILPASYLYAGQEATVRTGHGTMDWFQIRKGASQGCILSPVYLTYMQSTSEKAMATHSSVLAWKIPWKNEPGRLQSMGSQRVIHDCVIELN